MFRPPRTCALAIVLGLIYLVVTKTISIAIQMAADGLFGRKSAFLFYIIFQSDAFHQFHNHKIQSAILSHVVYIYHIGIHQSGCCSGLTDKFGDKHSICPVITRST